MTAPSLKVFDAEKTLRSRSNNILVCGADLKRPGSPDAKSTRRPVLRRLVELGGFDSVLFLSSHPDTEKGDFEYSEAELQKFCNTNTDQIKGRPTKRIALVLEDIDCATLVKSKTYVRLMMNARHYGLSVFQSVYSCAHVRPAVRRQMSFVMVTSSYFPKQPQELKRMHRVCCHDMEMDTLELFSAALEKCAGKVLVLSQTGECETMCFDISAQSNGIDPKLWGPSVWQQLHVHMEDNK